MTLHLGFHGAAGTVTGSRMRAGTLPSLPIHIDSPMAVDASRIYATHLRDHNLDEDIVQGVISRLSPPTLHYHRTVDESRALNDLPGPRVIISASGMLTGGRILHHLARLLPDDRNLILLVGYQAAGTRGRALLESARSVKIHGGEVPAAARCTDCRGTATPTS